MDSLCRTCMRSLPNLLPLFENNHLQIKIETLTSIKIIKDDRRFPSKICGECIDNINKFYNFRIIIINNDLDFRIRYLALHKQTIYNEGIANENCETSIDVNKIEEVDIKDWDHSIYNNVIKSENFEATVDEEGQTSGDVNIKQEINDCYEPQPLNHIVRIRYKGRFLKCTQCDFKASDSKRMAYHRKNHRKGVCNVCGKSIRMDNMGKHMKIHTEGKVTCPKCGIQSKNSECLRAHLLHHSTSPIVCEICGRSCKRRAEYVKHKKRHTGDIKKSTCSICNKEFPSERMKQHMMYHTGERPHSCKYCDKGFITNYRLKAHMRQHTNERPYSCEHCPMSFRQKVSLTTHLATKH